MARLSVNLTPDVAAALRELVAEHGTSATEETRRAISLYRFAMAEAKSGHRLLVERGDALFEVALEEASARADCDYFVALANSADNLLKLARAAYEEHEWARAAGDPCPGCPVCAEFGPLFRDVTA